MSMRIFVAALLAITLISTQIFLPSAANAEGNTNTATMTIAAGVQHSLAIQSDGSLWSWGFNIYGELGDGSTEWRGYPRRIKANVVSVAASFHSLAITSDGGLWAWGANHDGQIGDGTTQERLIPVRVMDDVIQVAAGAFHTMAIRADGSLWAWGCNRYGQLGNGTVMNQRAPVRIMENVAQVSAGEAHTMALRTDGSLYAWGANESGQLGVFSDDWMLDTPTRVMENIAQVSAGRMHTMAITVNGSLYTWGNNWTGQLGDGTATLYDPIWFEGWHFPARVMEGVIFAAAARGDFSMAITSDGYLYSWGLNDLGQLGDGTTIPWEDPIVEAPGRLTPTRIMGDVAHVSAGGDHTLAIRTDGSLWGWGDNGIGQLGDGTRIDRLIPTLIMRDVMLPYGAIVTTPSQPIPTPTDSASPDDTRPAEDFHAPPPGPQPVPDSDTTTEIQWENFVFPAIVVVIALLLVVLLINGKKWMKDSKSDPSPPKSGRKKSPVNQHKNLLKYLRAGAAMVSDSEIADKIKRLEELTTKIFSHVEEHPHKSPQIRRIVEYYLPAIIKMIRSYAAIEKQGVKGSSVKSAKKTIGNTLDTLTSGFLRQHDLMFESDLVDMSTDEDVIENMLRQDGLMGTSPFLVNMSDDEDANENMPQQYGLMGTSPFSFYGEKTMNDTRSAKKHVFWIYVLMFIPINICITILIGVSYAGGIYMLSSNLIGNLVLFYIGIFSVAIAAATVIAILIAKYCRKKQIKSIWFIPVAQVILMFTVSMFLYLRDVLGFRRGAGGWIDFGVGFEIGIIIMYGLLWLVPAAILAFVYQIYPGLKSKRRR